MDFHNKDVISEFTKQASTFDNTSSQTSDFSLKLMIRLSEPTINDTVLDVACGNGSVAFEYATIVKHVTGIDLTPAMIDLAKTIQKERHSDNLDWRIGDITELPFRDNSFSIVVTRGSLHHLTDSIKVMEEMYRVCMPGGKIIITDSMIDRNKMNELKNGTILRGVSYTEVLTLEDILEEMKVLGVTNIQSEQFESKGNLEASSSLSSSHAKSDSNNENFQLLKQETGVNNLEGKHCMMNDRLQHNFPMYTVIGMKRR